MGTHYNKKLADYYSAQPLYLDEEQKKPNTRKVVELPWHLSQSNQKQKLINLFQNIQYVFAKIELGYIYNYLQEFILLQSAIPTSLESWRLFFQKHAHRIEKSPIHLFPLITFEGFPELKELLPSLPKKKERIEILKEIAFQNNANTDKQYSAEILHQYEGMNIICSAIATSLDIAFIVSKIGTLTLFDLKLMRPIPVDFQLRFDRPIKILCPIDGSSLAVVYTTGIIDIYECLIDNLEVHFRLNKIGEYKSIILESLDPVLEFFKNEYWFLSSETQLSAYNISQKRLSLLDIEFDYPGIPVFVKVTVNAIFYAIKYKNDIILYKDHERIAYRNNTEIIILHSCRNEKLVAAFTDGMFLVIEKENDAWSFKEYILGYVHGNMMGYENTIMWLGNCNSCWVFDSEQMIIRELMGDEIMPKNYINKISSLATDPNHNLITSLKDRIIRIKLSFEQNVEHSEILGVSDRKKLVAIFKSKDSIQVANGSVPIDRFFIQNSPKPFFIEADNDYVYVLTGVGEGGCYDLSLHLKSTIRDGPKSINSICNEPEGGLWISDRFGGIYYCQPTGNIKKIFDSNQSDVSASRIINCGEILVWAGYSSNYFPESGVDISRTYLFFKKELKPIHLNLIGEQHRKPSEGIPLLELYNPVEQELLLVWLSKQSGSDRVYLRRGIVKDLIEWKFIEVEIIGDFHSSSLNRGCLMSNGRFIALLDMSGKVVVVSTQTGKVITSIWLSKPFSNIVHSKNSNSFWGILNDNILIECSVEGVVNE